MAKGNTMKLLALALTLTLTACNKPMNKEHYAGTSFSTQDCVDSANLTGTSYITGSTLNGISTDVWVVETDRGQLVVHHSSISGEILGLTINGIKSMDPVFATKAATETCLTALASKLFK